MQYVYIKYMYYTIMLFPREWCKDRLAETYVYIKYVYIKYYILLYIFLYLQNK